MRRQRSRTPPPRASRGPPGGPAPEVGGAPRRHKQHARASEEATRVPGAADVAFLRLATKGSVLVAHETAGSVSGVSDTTSAARASRHRSAQRAAAAERRSAGRAEGGLAAAGRAALGNGVQAYRALLVARHLPGRQPRNGGAAAAPCAGRRLARRRWRRHVPARQLHRLRPLRRRGGMHRRLLRDGDGWRALRPRAARRGRRDGRRHSRRRLRWSGLRRRRRCKRTLHGLQQPLRQRRRRHCGGLRLCGRRRRRRRLDHTLWLGRGGRCRGGISNSDGIQRSGRFIHLSGW